MTDIETKVILAGADFLKTVTVGLKKIVIPSLTVLASRMQEFSEAMEKVVKGKCD